ncbi:MAG: rRNA maturation RNase YbeY [Pseudoflavonifractor sp.]|nr:rRNA maturation RNase YbeY [Pseudoflavonifractor sp.]
MAIQSIDWNCEGVAMPAIDTDLYERWIAAVVAAHDRICGPLVYRFCDDEEILRVNRQFLNHDYYTDIITFDYSRGRLVSGDMVISLETVASNADAAGATYARELARVIIHGVLHLCGINDKGPGEREVMEAHEDAALSMLDAMA